MAGRLQFFVDRGDFFVGGLELFVRRFQFFDSALQVLTGGPQLVFQLADNGFVVADTIGAVIAGRTRPCSRGGSGPCGVGRGG